MAESNPPVMVPEDCQSSYGPPSDTRNSECSICVTEFEPQTSIITHPSCRNSFCAACLLQWHASSEQVTCPVCRGHLGADVHAPGYDKDIKELQFATAGSQGLRDLVGAEIFDRAPLIERYVRTRSVKDVEADRFIASYNSGITTFNDVVLSEWRLTDGIARAKEYLFLDWRAAALCYTPVEPMVRAVANINDLADYMQRMERVLRHVPSKVAGIWLRKRLSTAELRGKLQKSDNISMQNVSQVENGYAGCTEYPIEWALHSAGGFSDNVIFACPRKVFVCIYSGTWRVPNKPGFLRSFVARGGTRHVTPDPDRDPDLLYHHRALYDYRRAFPEIDGTGISTRLPLSIEMSHDNDLGLPQLFGDAPGDEDLSDDEDSTDDERLVDVRHRLIEPQRQMGLGRQQKQF